uniref:Uncharacterized protein n=1 Tax=Rousettus aegyptiacus TaxID=9407 RepID=A0A7J8FJR9_ROUAE|nr:hypothetical protein HJG63_011863 [Rousettus aegyptiacus]
MHTKRCSTSLAIREIQIKTTMRRCFKSPRMVVINKTENKEGRWRCGEPGIVPCCWWGRHVVQPLGKTVWRVLRSLSVGLPHDPAISSPGIYPGEMRARPLDGVFTNVYSSIIHKSQKMETSLMFKN